MTEFQELSANLGDRRRRLRELLRQETLHFQRTSLTYLKSQDHMHPGICTIQITAKDQEPSLSSGLSMPMRRNRSQSPRESWHR